MQKKQPPSPRSGNQLPTGEVKKGTKYKQKITQEAEALGIPTPVLRDIKKAARVKFETIIEQANILMDDMQTRAHAQGRAMDDQEAKTFSTQLEALKTTLDGKANHSALEIKVVNDIGAGHKGGRK